MPEYMTRKDKRKMESFLNLDESVTIGTVKVELEKCTGCGFCAKTCPVKLLRIEEKKCRINDGLNFCFSCGSCVAICPEDAIRIVQFLAYKLYFRFLDRGEPERPRVF